MYFRYSRCRASNYSHLKNLITVRLMDIPDELYNSVDGKDAYKRLRAVLSDTVTITYMRFEKNGT